MSNKLVQYDELGIAEITENLWAMEADWCINLCNSGYDDYGVHIKFDELVALRDALTEIIESRKSQ